MIFQKVRASAETEHYAGAKPSITSCTARRQPAIRLHSISSALYGFFLTAHLTPTFFTHTVNLDDGLNIPTRENAQRCSFDIRRVHPSYESCQGHRWYPPSPNCPCFHYRSFDYDYGTFSLPCDSNCPGHDVQQSGLHRILVAVRCQAPDRGFGVRSLGAVSESTFGKPRQPST